MTRGLVEFAPIRLDSSPQTVGPEARDRQFPDAGVPRLQEDRTESASLRAVKPNRSEALRNELVVEVPVERRDSVFTTLRRPATWVLVTERRRTGVGRSGLEPPTSAVLGPERSTTDRDACDGPAGVIRPDCGRRGFGSVKSMATRVIEVGQSLTLRGRFTN